jgi:hypothetical protein
MLNVMDGKYPHWYHDDMGPCYEKMMHEGPFEGPMIHEEPMMPHKIHACCDSNFKDRLLCLLGDQVLFSVDARICHRESFCGTLCYVGCDFIIVNVCVHRRSVSMHIPIRMIRFIAPYKED